MSHTLESAIVLCRLIETVLAPLGYHCALTGSVLYKGESEKDTDVIIYPHDPASTKPHEELLAALAHHGFAERIVADPNEEGSHKMNRKVAVMGHQDRRVDLFLM